MKNRGLLAVAFPAMLVSTASYAQDKTACLDAASKGQRFRDVHQLVEAREQFRVCAAATCPGVVQSDCANWLAEVENALPTVVLTAKGATGLDLVDVRVSVDGHALVSKLDGRAVPMNAGTHTFRFEANDGSVQERQVLVREGEKSQAVAAIFGAAGQGEHQPDGAVDARPAPASDGHGSWKTLGWVLGSLGVAGLGVGAVMGIVAIGDKNGAHCDANGVCDPGTTSSIRSSALASDIGWIAGGVLLGAGAALVLLAPSAAHEGSVSVKVAPVLTAGGGGAALGGAW